MLRYSPPRPTTRALACLSGIAALAGVALALVGPAAAQPAVCGGSSPTLLIVSCPPAQAPSNDASFAFATPDAPRGSGIAYSLDGSPPRGVGYALVLHGLAPGSHLLTLMSASGFAGYSWTVPGPVAEIAPPVFSGMGNTVTVSWSDAFAIPAWRYTWTLDGGAPHAAGLLRSITFNSLSRASHFVAIRAQAGAADPGRVSSVVLEPAPGGGFTALVFNGSPWPSFGPPV